MNIYEMNFFEGVDVEVIKEIENSCVAEIFEKGAAIFEKGRQADFLYILEKGNIDLLIKDKELIICNLTEPGEVFGWSSIVEKGIYTASCICRGQTKVLKISKDKIEDIFNRYPKAAVTFYRRLGSIFSKRLSKALEGTQ
ncbi:cyclic nucleotide-binding domain-containing protein [Desulfobacula sp.]|uniref:cyclic nucleotide-binding domain-containing protein n=1 Tax=Desulfobacula sp. TaxID=2593537 RepID=UPI002619DBFC|nr:cyclic nucleotide-binding domain-containing protein [Desulfobacula sp.]